MGMIMVVVMIVVMVMIIIVRVMFMIVIVIMPLIVPLLLMIVPTLREAFHSSVAERLASREVFYLHCELRVAPLNIHQP